MTGFSVTAFGGLVPVADPRKMRPGAATEAKDCDLQATDLRTFSPLKFISDVNSLGHVYKSGFVFNEGQMFLFLEDVDATYGPVRAEEDVHNRVFLSSGFQEFPTYSTKYLGLPEHGEVDYHGTPIDWRRLGVIAGPVKPIATVASAVGGVANLLAGNPTILQGGESGPLATTPSLADSIKSGSRVRISGLENEGWIRINNNVFVVDRDTEEGSAFLNFLTLRALNTADLVTEGNVDGSEVLEGSEGPFVYSDECSWQQEFDTADVEDRYYVYTLVTALGEEGPPSVPSDLLSVGTGQSVTIQTPGEITDPGAEYAFKRIYRTTPTSVGTAQYYFVAEIPIGQEIYVDTIDYIALGEELQSLDWYRPPEGLVGLTVLPNGVMAGFIDRTLYLSEPYQPHAWPDRYTKNMDNPIVGIAAFGQQLVVATKENPYVGTATDPLSMTFSKLGTVEPCISKRAMRTLGYGVVYPSPNGLILVSPAGVKNVLFDVWDQKEWRKLFKAYSDSFAVLHDGQYYLTFYNLDSRISDTVIFDPSNEALRITQITQDQCSGMIVDRDEDRLFWMVERTVTETTSGGSKVLEWNPDADPESLEAKWTSQVFVMPMEVNMGAMQIYYDRSWPDQDAYTIVDFWVDDVFRYSIAVTTDTPIRLPGGFLGLEWKLAIRTTRPIQTIYVAETIDDLRGTFSR